MSTRKAFVLIAALGVSALLWGYVARTSGAGPRPDWPTHAWRTVAPEAEGFDSRKLAQGIRAIRDKDLPIHSLLVVRDGAIILDATFYPYDGATPHDLASVTKTIMTALVGIAADQGKLGLDDTVVSFYRDRTIANRDERKNRVTIRDLVTMSSGLACTADQNERNLSEMQQSSDPIQYVLDLPMAAEPGSRFAYCSPGMHLLSAILQQATGMTALDFARRYLFEPLGVADVIWPSDGQGHTHGWGDLRLLPRDAAKIGYLWANGGIWDGGQIVSRNWVDDSIAVQARTGEGDDYGYGWWLPVNSKTGEYAAVGRGGQRIAVHRKLNLVLVMTAAGLEPARVTDLLAPALVDPDHALPANASGVADLAAALAAIRQPQVHPVPPLPTLARTISGRTWRFAENDEHLRTVELSFAATEASLRVTFSDGTPPLSGPVGLDGAYRLGSGRTGLPAAFRGSWSAADIFTTELDEIANDEAYLLTFTFHGDRLTLDGRDRTSGASFSVIARAGVAPFAAPPDELH